MFRVPDCIAGCVWLAVPQPTEWQQIGAQIDAAFIFARADFVLPHAMHSGWPERLVRLFPNKVMAWYTRESWPSSSPRREDEANRDDARKH